MITNLTSETIRLCDEIAALRDRRTRLRNGLARWRDDLKENVFRLRADFRRSHKETTARAKAELRHCVENVKDAITDLKQGVAAFQEQLAADFTGAQRAWRANPNPAPAHFNMAGEEQGHNFHAKAKRRKR